MYQHGGTLSWKMFSSNLTSSLSDLFTGSSFSDVTLVSDDKILFRAHKYILASFSPALKSLLLDNPHHHPIIYLRGIMHTELHSILQFIYLGEAFIHHSNFNRFSQAAEDLKIQELTDKAMRVPLNDTSSQDKLDNSEDQNKKEDALNIHENMLTQGIYSDYQESSKKLYKCEKCDASYKSKTGLSCHLKSKHEGFVHFCQYCGYKTSHLSHLKTHHESIHEGVKYSCDYCDYKASVRGSLKSHQEAIHEGVKYSCYQCDSKFTKQNDLKRHKKSVHEGVRYSCDQCKFQAKRKDHLKLHKGRKHTLHCIDT